MTSIKRVSPLDLLSLNLTNLDPLTENYDLSFYLEYLTKWPSLFSAVKDRDAGITGYIMGKVEEQHPSMRHSEHYTPWHGHITVLTVAPAWRRLGQARRLTEKLEQGSDNNKAWFVDLYVRASNKVAVDMYKGMGYSVFRRVVSYYSDDPSGMSESGEDAFDMRKPCSRDKKLKYVRDKGEDFLVSPADVS
ncbi:N-terminal acetyltransferase B complex catalytic subunit naa20 [Penicillium herquei]|uniref:N-terminal acetyltransferase B complex catalytic subunit naa20 n=1 Tax=Penicillium malachiteum TaxID=1324776 RepID=UPI00254997F0|nr:N-terminal acetyltransferase B complex catalytic subunit naa20 [Penicillium malachiteum]KAJ5712857.1 N-terminal acetyltransferase B complex catalytic subunit naa20 [Penicillium malachiteum]KAJ6037318.1 N-terminal acetyltransferase B complex catalytic subunit naa20 [Penicillium herquei]